MQESIFHVVDAYQPINAYKFLRILSSASMILLKITLETGMVLQIILRRVVGNVLINISHSNIFQALLSLEIFTQNHQAAFGRTEC